MAVTSSFLLTTVIGLLLASGTQLQRARASTADQRPPILQVIRSHADLSEFAAVLQLDGLHQTFLDRPVTVLAPTNKAMKSFTGRRTENLALNHMTNVPILSYQLDSKLTTLMTGSPPLYTYRLRRTFNQTGIHINQAQILTADLLGQSSKGDQQILHIIDSVLEPLVPLSLRESEYFVGLDARKLLSKSTLYDLNGSRLRVFFDQAEINGKTSMFAVPGTHTFFFPVDSAFDVSVQLTGHDYERGRATSGNAPLPGPNIRKELVDGRVLEGHIVPHQLLFTNMAPTSEFPTVAWIREGIQVNVSLQPASLWSLTDSVRPSSTSSNSNWRHTYVRNNYEHEDQVGGYDVDERRGNYSFNDRSTHRTTDEEDDRQVRIVVRSNTIVGDRAHPRGMVVAKIVRGNIPVQNGVVHLIDKPLMIVARTLYEYVIEEGRQPGNRLSSFAKLLRDKGGLFAEALLEAKDGTLFAPSNEALKRVNMERLEYILGNEYLRAEMLGLHFIRERIITTDFKIQAQGEQTYSAPASLAHNRVWMHFDRKSQLMTVQGRGVNATVTEKDIGTINGVVQVIDRVLGVPYQSVAQMMASDPDMSHLWSLMKQLHLDNVFHHANPHQFFTLVVPTNSAWEKASRDFSQAYGLLIDGQNPEFAKAIIERHLRLDERLVSFEELVEMSRTSPRRTVDMISGSGLTFTQVGEFHLNAYKDNFVQWMDIQGKVIRPNLECVNGYIHLIDTVLMDDAPPWAVSASGTPFISYFIIIPLPLLFSFYFLLKTTSGHSFRMIV